MTEELNQDQEADATPDNGGTVESLKQKLAEQEEALKNMNKGIEKLASKLNDKSESKEEQVSNPGQVSNVVKQLYMDKHPELETVWDDVVEEARAMNVDPIDYYESKKGWQLEAQARAKANKEKEEAKNSIEEPSSQLAGSNSFDYSKIKPEQISKLNQKQRDEYREYLRNNSPEEPLKRIH